MLYVPPVLQPVQGRVGGELQHMFYLQSIFIYLLHMYLKMHRRLNRKGMNNRGMTYQVPLPGLHMLISCWNTVVASAVYVTMKKCFLGSTPPPRSEPVKLCTVVAMPRYHLDALGLNLGNWILR